jgi:hypothetical protein
MIGANRKWKAGPPTTAMSAEQLIARGYRKVSNAYGLVARIDREDWKSFLAEKLGLHAAELLEDPAHWAALYRSTYSEDVRTVSFETMKRIPTSDHDPVGYVPLYEKESSLNTRRNDTNEGV